jgi:hypothetical protein
MTNLINSSPVRTTLGDNFDTLENTIYKEPNEIPSDFVFTKTLSSTTLIYRETETGRLTTNYNNRISSPPDTPIRGPFIPNYCHTGSLLNEDFINLLLIDKPPIRTGFFEFSIGGINFVGLVVKLTEYDHWNWERYFNNYNYVKQSNSLGYGIEISNNLLYTANYLETEQKYIFTPTALYNSLSNLKGGEEITSVATTTDPNTYLNPITGYKEENINTSLPIDLFFIPPADALRYIASYPDLIIGLGIDFIGGQKHHAEFNRKITFNPISYLNSNPDLRSIFNYDTYSATIHYITTGYFENRPWEEGSTYNTLTGGLYDERSSSYGLSLDSIIWSNSNTLKNLNNSLTYRYNRDEYYLNGVIDFDINLTYLRKQ